MFTHTDWTLETGQHWALIGPNGAGKSVLANALCRQTSLADGRIRYHFEPAGQARSYCRRGEIVRIAPQDQAALTWGGYHQARWHSGEGGDSPTVETLLTGENIEFVSPYQVGPTRISPAVYAARRQRVVERFGLAPLLERQAMQLSNGEARQVLIARALMQSPHLLILDDPYCGLDIAARRRLQGVLEDLLAATGPQVLLVVSRPEEIPTGITHILGVADGQIAVCGRRDTVMASSFARTLFAPSGPQDDSCAIAFPAFAAASAADAVWPIVIRHASVAYHGVQLLQGIDWTVGPEEHWAVLGPNGAGKSTLLSLILADNPQAYANDIALFGKRRGTGESIWEIKRRIGWVAPELQFHFQTASRCLEVVCSGFFDSIGLYRDCTPQQQRQAGEWMAALGIAALKDHPFTALSAGQQRLVLLARALARQPALLILDEPCQGLDPGQRRRIVGLLDRLCIQTPVQLLYVTHHADELPRAITHVLELDRGRVRACGPR